MIPNSIYGTAQSRNATLKRDRTAFHLSTAAFSAAQTANRRNDLNVQPEANRYRPGLSPPKQHSVDPQTNIFSKIRISNSEQETLESMQSFKKLQKLIGQQKNILDNEQKIPQHRTHSYLLSKSHQEGHFHYHMTDEREFPPKIVKQIYDKELLNSKDGNVQYHAGNLEKCGYLYFSIERVLILIRSLNFQDALENQEPIIIEASSHVIFMKELIVADLEVQEIQRHAFGQKSIIFVLWLKWEIQFYSYEPRELVKIKNLNMKFETSCEAAFLIDYCRKGNLYYLSESGELGRIELFYQNAMSVLNISKKFSIREHFFKFKHDTKRKKESMINLGIIDTMKQMYKDIKYYWSSKKTKGLQIFCDKRREFVYTLVETSIKTKVSLNRLQNQTHREIRVYSISESPNLNFLSKIESSIYGSPPNLIMQITEQKLFQEIGAHIFANMTLQKFQVSGIHVPQKSLRMGGSKRSETNLIVVLANGSRLWLYVSESKFLLNQLINMPNFDLILKSSLDPTKTDNQTITQKEPLNFKLIQYHFHPDGSFAILALYRRTVLGVLLTQCIGRDNCDQEEVEIFWEESFAEMDQLPSSPGSIFINLSDFKIFAESEMESNIYKSQLQKYKTESFEETRDRKEISIGCRESPENRQALHYPYQYLFVYKDKMRGVIKLRPVDIVLGALQKEINSSTSNRNLNALLYNDSEIRTLVNKIYLSLSLGNASQRNERLIVLSTLVQVFCDIDGVYYFQQFGFSRMTRQTMNMDEGRANNKKEDRDSTSDFLSNQDQGKRRMTQKFNRINAFRKYRYSDLCTSQNFMANQYSSSPIKIRSDSSTMKLVEKIIIFLISSGRSEKASDDYNRKFQQGEWAHSTVELSELSTSEVEEGILTYLSRLISPIWNMKIKSIQNFVFVYLTEVSKKAFELLARIQEQSIVYRLPFSFTQTRKLCSALIEYNSMLSALTMPADFLYGEGLGKQKERFEELIFYSLQKKSDLSSTVNEWKEAFPNYFSLRLFKAVKLKAEIATLPKMEDRKQLIIKNSKLMPPYLLYSYLRDGTLDRKEFSFMMEMQGEQQSSDLKHVSHLLMTDAMDPYQKIEYALGQIGKETLNLDQKQFLIGYALQNVGNVRNKDRNFIEKKKKELEQLEQVVKIQQLMSRELKRFEKDKVVSEKTTHLINFVLLTPTQLKGLVKELKDPMISIIFYCCFWDNSQNVDQMLRQLALDSQQLNFLSSDKMRERLVQVFKTFSKNITNRLPLSSLLSILDQIAYKELPMQDLTFFVRKGEDSQIRKIFWVPLFLGQYGWSQMMTLDHYTEQFTRYYLNCELKTQKQFMYYWLSAYSLVRFSYSQGIRALQVITETTTQFNNDPRPDSKILVEFLRDKLAY